MSEPELLTMKEVAARVAQAMAAKIDDEFMVEATPAQEAQS